LNQRVREMTEDDAPSIVNYFLKSDRQFLTEMGVDREKLPPAEQWINLILDNFNRPVPQKEFYYLIWDLDGSPIGHSNINKIIIGKEAYMHLHLWQSGLRYRGLGTGYVRESVSIYFEKFNLKTIYSEPYALNPAPNKVLENVGFKFVKTYKTNPGWINFYQPVNRWILTRDIWLKRL